MVGRGDGDVDFGGDDAGCEGVLVEWIEEAFELVAAFVNDAASADVDGECEDDGNPYS